MYESAVQWAACADGNGRTGNIFDTTVTVSAATSTTEGIYTGEFDLTGYKIDLTGPSGISFNTMITSYTGILSPQNTDTVQITAGQLVDVANTFVDIMPQYAKGYLGQTSRVIGPDSSDFTMFDHIVDGTLDLEDMAAALAEKPRLLPFIADLSGRHRVAAIIPVSAEKGSQVDRLLDEIVQRLPESPPA